jgi:hypothetical protein
MQSCRRMQVFALKINLLYRYFQKFLPPGTPHVLANLHSVPVFAEEATSRQARMPKTE